ncbi:hypothetical protein [Aquihabitans sp. McL0605]|uniref:hypothetical protein n=1 Tax=Aquihabitans sp. McL0605 TaxID=3415671 RepID=UPI003CE8BE98
MSDQSLDRDLQDFLEIRQPGADYEELKRDDFAIQLGVDLENYKKFPRVDDAVTYPKVRYDTRADIDVEHSQDLSDYSGPFQQDLRFSDFSREALVRMLGMSHEYYVLLVEAWAGEIAARQGEEKMQEIQTAVWTNGVGPHLDRITQEWGALPDVDVMPELGSGVVTFSLFAPDARYEELDKEQLVNLALGSHELLLLVIECWAAEIVVRDGLDEMFDIQWVFWSEKVLPEVRNLKGRWMNITTNDVAAFMKDIQIDATSFPGKAFDLIFEMPEEDVGIMTFNKCCAPDQWEALGRPDILEKNCHSTCPASLIETAKMYNPNMKVDILAIPPRVSDGDVCCKWKLSMRDESDPEFVPIELGPTHRSAAS